MRRPVELEPALAQQHRALAQPLHLGGVVGDEDDRAAALLELEDLAEALALEGLVADGEDLVEQEDVRVEMRRDREAEPHVHPRGVGAHGPVDRLLELGEGDDLVEALADLRALEPVDGAVEEDVLAAAEVGVEAGAELEQRADPAADLDAARRRLDDPGDQAQQRRLAGAVAADEPDGLARLDRERDVVERLHVLRLGAAAEDEQLLQAARLVRVDAEAARDPVDPDLARLHPVDGTAAVTPDEPGEHADEGRVGVRQLDPVELEPELGRALLRLDVEVPSDLEVVGDEADRRDEHLADAVRGERIQVLEDVRPEPGLARRRLALERERPLLDARLLGDEPRRLEQLVLVGVALVEDPRRQRVGREDDVGVGAPNAARRAGRRTRARRPSARRSGSRRGRRRRRRAGRGTARSTSTSSAAPARGRRSRRRRRRAPARPRRRSAAASGACR